MSGKPQKQFNPINIAFLGGMMVGVVAMTLYFVLS